MTTKIEWTDETWNPVTGCTKVSQGCKNCYAERLAPKVFAGQRVPNTFAGGATMGTRKRVFTDVMCHPERLDAPLHWKKPRRIFVNSMSDLFHDDVPDDFLDAVFRVMVMANWHTFQVLTKRPQRAHLYLTRNYWGQNKGRSEATTQKYFPPRNVWLGVSVEDQATADERIPLLLQTPAALRFLSCEPLLGEIDLRDSLCPKFNACQMVDISRERILALVKAAARSHGWNGIDWCIAGGESGPKARPSHPDWFRQLRDQCAAAGVPYFFKQWGEWGPAITGYPVRDAHRWPIIEGEPEDGVNSYKVGKKAAGRTLDGREHMEYPA